MPGYIYVIRIGRVKLSVTDPDPVPEAWADVRDDLCLLKIGKTKPHQLPARLNTEALAWGKVLAPQRRREGGALLTKTVGRNVFPVIDTGAYRPAIYLGASSVKTEKGVSRVVGDKLLEMRSDSRVCADIGCWLWRGDEHHIAEDERFVATLMGAPLRAHLIENLVAAWNAKTFYEVTKRAGELRVAGRKLGSVSGCQFGVSEYVISTNTHFNRLRAQFLAGGAFTLDMLTSAVATDSFVLRIFRCTEVGFSVETLPAITFQAPHLLRILADLPEREAREEAVA